LPARARTSRSSISTRAGTPGSTAQLVEGEGRQCLAISGDVGDPTFCAGAVQQVMKQFGRLDILVNNAAEQHPKKDPTEITPEQLERTFRTNILAISS
jgi:NAD(P)-dependent dehydrogenase (short-subunit alcohol dehydrogenase family)